MNDLITNFITIFTVVDPIGTIPVFIAVTSRSSAADKRKIALRAALVAAGILIFFIVVGELVLDAIDVSLPIFQIAGGIVLFLFALTMIFGESKPEEEVGQIKEENDKAIFPLAIPSLASPGAILAAILLTENSQYSVVEQSMTALIVVAVIFIAWVFMTLSTKIFKYIGNSGAAIISRVMGLILSSIAISHIVEGITVSFGL